MFNNKGSHKKVLYEKVNESKVNLDIKISFQRKLFWVIMKNKFQSLQSEGLFLIRLNWFIVKLFSKIIIGK